MKDIDMSELLEDTTVLNELVTEDGKPLKGSRKAAIIMLILGKEGAREIFRNLNEEDVREIAKEMSSLGIVKASVVEGVCREFSDKFKNVDGVIGSYDVAADYLRGVLDPDMFENIMDTIKGPSGRNVWAKLSNMPEDTLANYLRNEQPQSIAVILSYINPAHVARVLSLFNEELATEVLSRILHLGPVNKEVMESIQHTLTDEFINTVGRSKKRDQYSFVAEVCNNLDRKLEGRLSERLTNINADDMEKVNKLKFTFEDIKRLGRDDLMSVVTSVNRDPELKTRMPLALKAASPQIKELFFSCMSKRAAGIMREEMQGMGSVKLRDAETAQMEIITLIKDMGKDGLIDISPSSSEEEMVE